MPSATSLTLVKLTTLIPSATNITQITLEDKGLGNGNGGHPSNVSNEGLTGFGTAQFKAVQKAIQDQKKRKRRENL